MAALGSHPGGIPLKPSIPFKNKSNHLFPSNPFLSISNPIKITPQKLVCASMASRDPALVSTASDETVISDSLAKDTVFTEKIDFWMQESVTEIVKNLKEAPLLVQIYAENDGVFQKARMKLKTEKACLDEWPSVRKEWESGESRSPDGLIFVEELEREEDQEIDGLEEGVARAWGIVVQRKGVECRPACYLLKTNSVCGGMGLGFCTHFCLMKVKNFRDSALEQFKNSWLLP